MVMNHCVEKDFLDSVSTGFPSPRAVGCDATVVLALYLCFVISKRLCKSKRPLEVLSNISTSRGTAGFLRKDLALSNEDWCF